METSTIEMITPQETAPLNGAPKTKRIHVKVTQERFERIPFGAFLDAQESMKGQAEFLARFIMGSDGVYLERDEAMKVIRQMEMNQVKELTDTILTQIEDISAPKK